MRSDLQNDSCAISPDCNAVNVPITHISKRKYFVVSRFFLIRGENTLPISIIEYNTRHAIGKWTIIGWRFMSIGIRIKTIIVTICISYPFAILYKLYPLTLIIFTGQASAASFVL